MNPKPKKKGCLVVFVSDRERKKKKNGEKDPVTGKREKGAQKAVRRMLGKFFPGKGTDREEDFFLWAPAEKKKMKTGRF